MSKTPESAFADEIDKITSVAKKDVMDAFTNWVSPSSNQLSFYSCILIFYMHWEGCIKKISENYIKYLENKNKGISLIPHFHYIIKNNKPDNIRWLKRISMRLKADKNNSKILIDTLNNLNYDAFQQILFILNIHENEFVEQEKTLNEFVKYRHDIAHGNERIYAGKITLTFEQVKSYKEFVITTVSKFSQLIIDSMQSIKY